MIFLFCDAALTYDYSYPDFDLKNTLFGVRRILKTWDLQTPPKIKCTLIYGILKGTSRFGDPAPDSSCLAGYDIFYYKLHVSDI